MHVICIVLEIVALCLLLACMFDGSIDVGIVVVLVIVIVAIIIIYL